MVAEWVRDTDAAVTGAVRRQFRERLPDRIRVPAERALETPCSSEETVLLVAAEPDACVTDG